MTSVLASVRRIVISLRHVGYVHCLFLLGTFFLLTIFHFHNGHGDDAEEVVSIQQQVDDLRERLRHANMMSQQRSNDINDLRRTFKSIMSTDSEEAVVKKNSSVHVGRGTLWQKHQGSPQSGAVEEIGHPDIQLPSLSHYLPHLSQLDGLHPAYKIATTRSTVTMVLGIPTVKRPVQSYLDSTLENLIENMSEQEKSETIIIVFIAENDNDYIEKEIEDLKMRFQDYLDSGLLEIIAPPENYYPDFASIRSTLGDPVERVKWRTKQNLDYAYLMMYAQSKGTYYVQLEDDILTKPHYISTMKAFVYKQFQENKDWIILDFCQLGFIGKMFKSVDLSKVVTFLAMFHNDKPVDWLLDHMVQTKVCRFDRDSKHCKKQKDSVWIHYKPSLFQHVGTHSSLKGKLQNLKDKQFGKVSSQRTIRNPPAILKSTLRAYRSHSLQRAYRGEDFFWIRKRHKGDIIAFHFAPPVLIERYSFSTGNEGHPEAILSEASVEVLLAGPAKFPVLIPYPTSTDGYLVVGDFRENPGVCEGVLVPILGPISAMRIKIEDYSDEPAILKTIVIETPSAESPMATAFNFTYSNMTKTKDS